MEPNEYLALRTTYEEELQQIKTGYGRIKEKNRAVRQQYRNCINQGTRSGSGRHSLYSFIYLFSHFHHSRETGCGGGRTSERGSK